MQRRRPQLLAMVLAGLAVASPAAEVTRVDLGKVLVAPGEAGAVTVQAGGIAGMETIHVELRGRLGAVLHSASAPAASSVDFAIPPQPAEGPLLLRAWIDDGEPVERVYSVVEQPATDVRYGFFAKYDQPSAPWAGKARILADLHINAVEYYDYFPGHGDYAPTQASYTNEPFNNQLIFTSNINGKATANRARNILNIAYIAAYSAIPEVAALVPDYLLDESGTPLVFYQGSVGTEAALGGVWFRLMAFAPDTAWRAALFQELGRALDALPSDRVQFEGFEVDTYGYQGAYNSAGSGFNGQPVADVLALFCEDLRALVKAEVPRGIVATNAIAEEFIETGYGKVDFLFVENWAFHKPRLEDVVQMCFGNTARSGLRLVSKSYPADTQMGVTQWPAANLRNLMAAHLAGGGSLMVAGEPDEATGAIGGLNSLYYPDYTLQPPGNQAIIRRHNAHDAALFGRNHGPGVRPVATAQGPPGAITTSFHAPDGATTFCFLNLSGAERWDLPNPAPSPMHDVALSLQLPNGLRPAAVLLGSPDDGDPVYPKPIPWSESGGVLNVSIPRLDTFASLLVEPVPLPVLARDAADDPAYDTAWAGGGGEGWSGPWQFSGLGGGASAFLGDSAGNGAPGENDDADINRGGRAWGLSSGSTGLVDAVREFPPLAPGDAIRLHLDNGWIEPGGVVGFDLRNAAGERLLGLEFRGGEGTYRVLDDRGAATTGLPFTDQGLDIEVELLPGSEYVLRALPLGREQHVNVVHGRLFPATSGQETRRLRLFSFRAGIGPRHDAFFNDVTLLDKDRPTQGNSWMLR